MLPRVPGIVTLFHGCSAGVNTGTSLMFDDTLNHFSLTFSRCFFRECIPNTPCHLFRSETFSEYAHTAACTSGSPLLCFPRLHLKLSSAIVPESPGFQTGDSLVGGHGSDNVDTDGDPSTSNSGIRGDSTGADVESLRPSLMPSGIQLVTDSNGTDNGIGIDNHGGNFVSSGGIVDETACHGEKGDAGVDGNTGVVGGSKHGKSQSGDGDGANQERDSDPSGEVAGPWWGVGGWFSRRSGMSPPPPTSQPDPPNPPSLGLSSPRASGSAGERGAAGRVDTTASERAIPGGGAGATDGAVSRRKDVDGEGGHRGRMKDSRASHEHLEEMEDATLATNGVDGESGDASHPHGDRGIPMPLSIEVVGKGHAPMVGGVDGEDHHDDDEDEDMYGKTLRPTSEQLVSVLRQLVDPNSDSIGIPHVPVWISQHLVTV